MSRYYRVQVLKDVTIEGRECSNGELVDIPVSEYVTLVRTGKIGQIVQSFEKYETAVKTSSRKVKKRG